MFINFFNFKVERTNFSIYLVLLKRVLAINFYMIVKFIGSQKNTSITFVTQLIY
jgi:hypothetical protein